MINQARSPRYTAVAIGLHWAIAGLLVGMIWLGWNMETEDGREIEWLYQLHKSIGITILFLTIARIIWRVKNPPPPLPEDMQGWEKTASHLVHIGFYALLLLVPLAGWALTSLAKVQVPTVLYGTVSWPHLPVLGELSPDTKATLYGIIEFMHSKSAWLIIVMLGLHVGGALKHEFAEEDGVLKRMIPGLFGKTGGAQAPPTGFFVAFGSAVAAFMLIAGGPVIAQSLSSDKAPAAQVVPSSSMAPNWSVDDANSKIEFQFTHDGDSYTGSFDDWDAQILFMEDNLGASRVVVTVDLTSVNVAKKLYTDSLKSPEWFNSTATPQAVIDLTDFKAADGARAYTANAALTLKDKTVSVPFAFTLSGDDPTVMQGSTVLSRSPLDLGQDSDPTGDWVGEDVQVNVTVTATPK